jgi:hypothetical protein
VIFIHQGWALDLQYAFLSREILRALQAELHLGVWIP